MNSPKANFTAAQLQIYNRVKSIEDEIASIADPSTFVYNPKIGQLIMQLTEVQNECEHVFDDGFCIICGRPEDDDQTLHNALS